MPTIVAANNLTIRTTDTSWELLNGRNDDPLVEASSNGLTYPSAFGTSRRLSTDGHLAPDQIAMVVVGWAVEDSSWHLGLMLSAELAKVRGGRWCGLARWDTLDGADPTLAGQLLAQTLEKPFKLVPPPDDMPQPAFVSSVEASTLLEQAKPAPVPLMDLPIALNEWLLSGDGEDSLLVERSRAWRNRILLNGGFLLALTALFFTLSFGAQFTIFAPVQPDWLPLIGIGLTLLLFLLTLGQFLTLTRIVSTVVDHHERFIRLIRRYNKNKPKSGRVLTQSPFEGIEYVLISHIIGRREDIPNPISGVPQYDRIWPEVWIHAYSPRLGFIEVCYISQSIGKVLSTLSLSARRALDLNEVNTPAHHAGLYIAEMIGVPAYVEER